MSETGNRIAINKLIILYFLDKIEIPLSRSYITQFLIESEYMNYFEMQQYLDELIELGYVVKENNSKLIITDEGSKTLSYLIKIIPTNIKKAVNQFIQKNMKKIRSEYEIASNFFQQGENDFEVKCGIYENDGTMLIEMKLYAPNKEQAKIICDNWKKNTNKIYTTIIDQLTNENSVNKNSANKNNTNKNNTNKNSIKNKKRLQ